MTGKKSYRAIGVMSVLFILLVLMATQQVMAYSVSEGSDVSQRGDAIQTNVAGTAQAVQTDVASTVQAGQGNVQMTAQAVQTQVASTVEANQGDVQMTVQARQTEIFATVDAIQTEVFATVEAVQTEIVATGQGVMQEFSDALEVIGADYDADAGTLTLTTTVNESQINEALDVFLDASSYEADITVDLIMNGVIITLDNYVLDNGQVVTVTLSFILVQDVITGMYGLDLLSVTVNGRAIPIDMIEDELDEVLVVLLETYIEDIVSGGTSDFSGNLPTGTTAGEVGIDNIVITDDFVAVLVVVVLE